MMCCKNYHYFGRSFLLNLRIVLTASVSNGIESGGEKVPHAVATFECIGLYWKAPDGAQKNGITSEARYELGHGRDEGKGRVDYQLANNTPGVDQAQRLPNFNDEYTNGGPDIGAHERGTQTKKFGVVAAPEYPESEQDAPVSAGKVRDSSPSNEQ
jgi:hypothetical protein